ncbi:ATP-binding protein [Mesoterricola silvestris]|uniref:ATP-binding protein n=1 Tax=Mesoterricola silvestris TaxID=2927979 RepID=UPI002930B280|nr:ATP-binding protein [Mesoterricola silvestris]
MERVQPNPYLTVPNRDIPGPGAARLTLINPAYMTRLAFETLQDTFHQPIQNRITSLLPINPHNAPNAWERAALQSFEAGATEAVQVQELDHKPYLFLMKPFITEASCLRCHGGQGYKVGDVRGAISIAIPLQPYQTLAAASIRNQAYSYSLIWGLGCCGLLVSARRRNRQQERMAGIFEESPVAQCLSDFGTGRFLQVNAAFLDVMRTVDRKRLVGRTSLEIGILLPEDRQRLKDALREKTWVERFQTPLRRLDGEAFQGELSLKRYEVDGVPYLLTSLVDVTERVQAAQDRIRLQDQLNQAQKMESIGRLAGGVAHDFNNMLSVILANADLALGNERLTPEFKRAFEMVRMAATRSADLTRQLLGFARKQAITPELVDLNEVIERVLKMLRRVIGEQITITWMPGRSLWPAHLDPSQIDQVLANLLVNARDAISGEGAVTITTENVVVDEAYCATHIEALPGDYIRISVADTGYGMDRATQEKIFEPFFTTKAEGKGTGLGLAMVYGVVRQNRGFIHVQSELGRGTTFLVYLPRHAGPAADPEDSPQTDVLPRGEETVLLVEDNEILLQSVQDLLRSLGYRVLAAGLPQEALALARSEAGPIHVLLTDLVMPGQNGWDLAQQVKELRPGIKFIFMSGYTAQAEVRQEMHAQGHPYLQKPFSLRDLAGKLREALGA